jgi:hypothetical protein
MGCWVWQGTLFKNTGYGQITYNKKVGSTHRLSLHAFCGFDLKSEKMVLHRCDVRSCVNPDHLYVGTQSDNMRDMVDRYRNRRGSSHPNAKLNESKVLEIKTLLRRDMKPSEIAKKFSMDVTTISKIKCQKIWQHVKEENAAT